MDPWNQLCFMDLVHVGEFVLAYLLNPTSYGHETCTIGYSKDWGLKGCVKVLWQPHQIWSYGPVKSAMFHGFGLGWLICGTISPEPYKLWTWDLYHWIQQRLRFKRMLEILWQPHQVWSYEPLNSTMFDSLVHMCKIVLGDLDADIWRLPHAPWSCVPVKKDSCILCTSSCMYKVFDWLHLWGGWVTPYMAMHPLPSIISSRNKQNPCTKV